MFRVGMGFDVHRFAAGRPCKIGGVRFEHPQGPLGHSDADVLLHAVCDALLGALALGDLGEHFPDTDPLWQNADSRELLRQCYEKVLKRGYVLENLDTVVVCEGPKIKPKRAEIQSLIAGLLNVSPEQISDKATTEENMGYTGSGEGIQAWAYVLLIKAI